MSLLRHLSLKIGNYKGFREPQGFESILPINVIIGTNNSGKSSLLDLIQAVATNTWLSIDHRRAGEQAALIRGVRLEKDVIEAFLGPSSPRGHDINLYGFVKSKMLGGVIEWTAHGNQTSLKQYRPSSPNQPSETYIESTDRNLFRNIIVNANNIFNNPFKNQYFGRILAERDMQAEANREGLIINPDGANATNLIQRLINQEHLPERLVEDTLLSELNRVFEPDTSFRRILIQRKEKTIASMDSIGKQIYSDDKYEIFLEEYGKGRIPLSLTGSGLKTTLLVLIHLHIAPKIKDERIDLSRPDKGLFAFEEIENNLHPALQRRLFAHVADFTRKTGSTLFLTTHSHIVVDMFSRADDAQLIRVSQCEGKAEARRITTFMEHGNLFRDLDVRASDLLQANAVVWVEGPSDRIYFNRWVELWDGELQEGLHYQCMYSGGRLIEGVTFNAQDGPVEADGGPDGEANFEELIEALRINRHAVVIMDKDRGPEEELKSWVSRIVAELEQTGGMPWVTAGREIENYVPPGIIPALSDGMRLRMDKPPGQYDSFFECVRGPRGGDVSDQKTAIARCISRNLTLQSIANVLDLPERLEAVCDRLREWNQMERCPRRAAAVRSGSRSAEETVGPHQPSDPVG